jgi:hypothetical protein
MEELERKIFEERSRDGIFELFVGLMFLAVGVMASTERLSLVGVAAAVAATMIPVFRARFIHPRLGVVRPSGKRAFWMGSVRLLTVMSLLGLVVLGLVLAVISMGGEMLEPLRQVMGVLRLDFFFLLMFFVFLMVGAVNGYRRLGYYFAGGVVLVWLRTSLNLSEPTVFYVAGGLLSIYGLYAFQSFLRRNPVIERSAENER